ncbi:MAG: TetR/AcrR family transcriptional regulator [Lachnospiraceae bacterium]
MKREEKNALSRQRILDAAFKEFSLKGYECASLNTICSEEGISKGIIYHHFKDKNQLYLLCIEKCFTDLTDYLKKTAGCLTGSAEEQLQEYFRARLRFFAEYPLYLGIFADAAFNPPANLAGEIMKRRQGFDDQNIFVLTKVLESQPVRQGLSVDTVVEDFRMYMDYFNMQFKTDFSAGRSIEELLHNHEERCHRQLYLLLHGVLGDNHED